MSLTNLILGCTVWIPIAVWIVSLLNWSIVGDIDGLSGFFGICTALALGVLTFRPPVPGLEPYTFGAVLLTVILYPIVRAGMNKKQLSGLDVSGIEQGYQLLGH
jgi:hypothetical protein